MDLLNCPNRGFYPMCGSSLGPGSVRFNPGSKPCRCQSHSGVEEEEKYRHLLRLGRLVGNVDNRDWTGMESGNGDGLSDK